MSAPTWLRRRATSAGRAVRRDRRAVSPTFSYVLTLGVATMLITGLVVAAGGFVDDQRTDTTRSELRVIGQQVSADVAAVDRLARTGGTTDVAVTRDLPRRVVGSSYTIRVLDDGAGPTDPYLELSTRNPDVTVTVGLATVEPVDASASAGGGRIVVEYEAGQVVLGNG